MTGVAPWGPPPAYRRLTPAEAAALAAVYAEVDAALAGASRACRACGRCCRFEPGGIILFATALELAYLVGEEPVPFADEGGMPAAAVPQACRSAGGTRHAYAKAA